MSRSEHQPLSIGQGTRRAPTTPRPWSGSLQSTYNPLALIRIRKKDLLFDVASFRFSLLKVTDELVSAGADGRQHLFKKESGIAQW